MQEGSYAASPFDMEALHNVAAAVAAKADAAQRMAAMLAELDAQITAMASEATRISTKLSHVRRSQVANAICLKECLVQSFTAHT